MQSFYVIGTINMEILWENWGPEKLNNSPEVSPLWWCRIKFELRQPGPTVSSEAGGWWLVWRSRVATGFCITAPSPPVPPAITTQREKPEEKGRAPDWSWGQSLPIPPPPGLRVRSPPRAQAPRSGQLGDREPGRVTHVPGSAPGSSWAAPRSEQIKVHKTLMRQRNLNPE